MGHSESSTLVTDTAAAVAMLPLLPATPTVTAAESGSNPPSSSAPSSASVELPEPRKKQKPPDILLVEDNRADVFLIRESIEIAGIDANLHVVQDGDKAIKFFEQVDHDPSATCPALVLLDINLPKRPGNEVLREMRQSRRCADAAVLVVTSSDFERDRLEMGRLAVKGYFRKPSDYEAFMKLGRTIKGLLAESASRA